MISLGNKIKNLRISLGMRQHEFGKRIGVPQGTISKWERDEDTPRIERAQLLAKLAGVPVEQFVNADPSVTIDPALGRRIPVIGAVQAGAWSEAVEWDKSTRYEHSVPIPARWAGIPIFGLEVRGDSFNRVYPDGSVVYVAPLANVPGAPQSGQVVVALRRDVDGSYETTLKEYVVDENGKKWLWPRSTSPEFQTPIPFVGSNRKSAEVRIVSIVVVATVTSPITFTRNPKRA